MAVASLVLGILSIICSFIGYQPVGIVLAVIGIVLGSKACCDPANASLARAGKICSIVGLVLCLLIFAVCALFVGAAFTIGSFV
ncbi:hypothetical protein NE664_01900 [Anaerotignum faecicola]|nr:hypothetical protein [Anaerotignum faecicola]